MSTLLPLLQAADAHRVVLLAKLQNENTNAYRLFHGHAEGRAGLTIDRYNDVLLIQTFGRPLSDEEHATILEYYAPLGLHAVYNNRSGNPARISNTLSEEELIAAQQPRVVSEDGVNYHFEARHESAEPWFSPELRAARRKVQALAADKSVLDLFAGTGSLGIAAAKGGASFVLNVDFFEANLRQARANAKLNTLPTRPRCVQSDAYAAIRQLSGIGQAKVVRRKKMPPFQVLEARQFDLVLLNMPVYTKSPFGVVDALNDYPALFKPALLTTVEGGMMLCVQPVESADGNAWVDQLKRSAAKVGRTVHDVEWITQDADLPPLDGQSALKMVLLHV